MDNRRREFPSPIPILNSDSITNSITNRDGMVVNWFGSSNGMVMEWRLRN
jgi:hypothetical protein